MSSHTTVLNSTSCLEYDEEMVAKEFSDALIQRALKQNQIKSNITNEQHNNKKDVFILSYYISLLNQYLYKINLNIKLKLSKKTETIYLNDNNNNNSNNASSSNYYSINNITSFNSLSFLFSDVKILNKTQLLIVEDTLESIKDHLSSSLQEAKSNINCALNNKKESNINTNCCLDIFKLSNSFLSMYSSLFDLNKNTQMSSFKFNSDSRLNEIVSDSITSSFSSISEIIEYIKEANTEYIKEHIELSKIKNKNNKREYNGNIANNDDKDNQTTLYLTNNSLKSILILLLILYNNNILDEIKDLPSLILKLNQDKNSIENIDEYLNGTDNNKYFNQNRIPFELLLVLLELKQFTTVKLDLQQTTTSSTLELNELEYLIVFLNLNFLFINLTSIDFNLTNDNAFINRLKYLNNLTEISKYTHRDVVIAEAYDIESEFFSYDDIGDSNEGYEKIRKESINKNGKGNEKHKNSNYRNDQNYGYCEKHECKAIEEEYSFRDFIKEEFKFLNNFLISFIYLNTDFKSCYINNCFGVAGSLKLNNKNGTEYSSSISNDYIFKKNITICIPYCYFHEINELLDVYLNIKKYWARENQETSLSSINNININSNKAYTHIEPIEAIIYNQNYLISSLSIEFNILDSQITTYITEIIKQLNLDKENTVKNGSHITKTDKNIRTNKQQSSSSPPTLNISFLPKHNQEHNFFQSINLINQIFSSNNKELIQKLKSSLTIMNMNNHSSINILNSILKDIYLINLSKIQYCLFTILPSYTVLSLHFYFSNLMLEHETCYVNITNKFIFNVIEFFDYEEKNKRLTIEGNFKIHWEYEVKSKNSDKINSTSRIANIANKANTACFNNINFLDISFKSICRSVLKFFPSLVHCRMSVVNAIMLNNLFDYSSSQYEINNNTYKNDNDRKSSLRRLNSNYKNEMNQTNVLSTTNINSNNVTSSKTFLNTKPNTQGFKFENGKIRSTSISNSKYKYHFNNSNVKRSNTDIENDHINSSSNDDSNIFYQKPFSFTDYLNIKLLKKMEIVFPFITIDFFFSFIIDINNNYSSNTPVELLVRLPEVDFYLADILKVLFSITTNENIVFRLIFKSSLLNEYVIEQYKDYSETMKKNSSIINMNNSSITSSLSNISCNNSQTSSNNIIKGNNDINYNDNNIDNSTQSPHKSKIFTIIDSAKTNIYKNNSISNLTDEDDIVNNDEIDDEYSNCIKKPSFNDMNRKRNSKIEYKSFISNNNENIKDKNTIITHLYSKFFAKKSQLKNVKLEFSLNE